MAITPKDDASPPLAMFEMKQGPRLGKQIAIQSPVVTIGQGSQNDVILGDDSVSATHARLEYGSGDWRLTDLGSTNGTYIGDTRLAPNVPAALAYGAPVRFGGVRLEFQPVDAADLEEARARYVPPATTIPLAQRRSGPRFPVWVFLLLLIALGIVIFFILRSPVTQSASPAPTATQTSPTPSGSP